MERGETSLQNGTAASPLSCANLFPKTRSRSTSRHMQSTVLLSLSLTPDRKDFVRSTFLPKISRILSSLVHGCRYESTYGFSSRAALLLVHLRIVSSLGSLRMHARYLCQGLSHAIRDPHRLQRKRKGNCHLPRG